MSLLQIGGICLLAFFLYGTLLVACEKKIIYHPYKYPEGYWDPASFGLNVEDVYFDSGDGVRLHGWYIPSPEARGTLLWYHGNAGNLTHRLDNIRKLRFLRLNIFIFDYRGYGKSEGSPDEEGLYRDSLAAYDYLTGSRGISPESLILFGRSLGGICAIKVASMRPAAGLILESVFTSAPDMAKTIFPLVPLGWAIKSKYDALSVVPGLTLPKLFLHGTRDEIVPYKLGQKLYQAASEPKEFYPIEGAGHNDTYTTGGSAYFEAWNRFISGVLEKKVENSR